MTVSTTETTSSSRPEPVRADQREISLDVLRGFALFGVLMVNLEFWFRTTPLRYHSTRFPYPGLPSKIVDALLPIFFESRFLGLFSLLFGAGLAIQAERAQASSGRPRLLLLRRLGILFLLGAAHVVLLWSGDILHIYAVIGLLLLLLARRKAKTVAIVGGVLLALPTVGPFIYAVVQMARGEPPPAPSSETNTVTSEEVDRFIRGYGQGDIVEVARTRFDEFVRFLPVQPFVMIFSFLLGTAGIFLWKAGAFQRASEHASKLRFVLALGLVFSLAVVGGQTVVHMLGNDVKRALGWWWIATVGLTPLSMMSGVLAYGAAILLLLERPRARAVLLHLAPVGRMALSNYLLQSVIGSLLFFGFGLGLYNKLNTAEGALVVIAIFAAQIALSRLWLQRFRFGPVEWLWRSLTYGKAQPMRAARSAEA